MNAEERKSYTTDTFPVTRYKNKGERQKYYAEGTHPPIIAKETFAQVQKLMQFRKGTFGKKLLEHPYPLSKKLVCGNCGTVFRRKLQRERAYWCCMKHDTSPNDCAMLPIAEESIYGAFCCLYYKLKHQSVPIFGQKLLEKATNDPAAYSSHFKEILDEQTFLKEKRTAILAENKSNAEIHQRIADAAELLDRDTLNITEWDESIIRQMVETVKVMSKSEIIVTLKGGAEINQRLE